MQVRGAIMASLNPWLEGAFLFASTFKGATDAGGTAVVEAQTGKGKLARVLRRLDAACDDGDGRPHPNFSPCIILDDGKHFALAFLSQVSSSNNCLWLPEGSLVAISDYTVSTVLWCTGGDIFRYRRLIDQLYGSDDPPMPSGADRLLLCLYVQGPVIVVGDGENQGHLTCSVDVHHSPMLRMALLNHKQQAKKCLSAAYPGSDGGRGEDPSHALLIRRLEACHCWHQVICCSAVGGTPPAWPWTSLLDCPPSHYLIKQEEMRGPTLEDCPPSHYLIKQEERRGPTLEHVIWRDRDERPCKGGDKNEGREVNVMIIQEKEDICNSEERGAYAGSNALQNGCEVLKQHCQLKIPPHMESEESKDMVIKGSRNENEGLHTPVEDHNNYNEASQAQEKSKHPDKHKADNNEKIDTMKSKVQGEVQKSLLDRLVAEHTTIKGKCDNLEGKLKEKSEELRTYKEEAQQFRERASAKLKQLRGQEQQLIEEANSSMKKLRDVNLAMEQEYERKCDVLEGELKEKSEELQAYKDKAQMLRVRVGAKIGESYLKELQVEYEQESDAAIKRLLQMLSSRAETRASKDGVIEGLRGDVERLRIRIREQDDANVGLNDRVKLMHSDREEVAGLYAKELSVRRAEIDALELKINELADENSARTRCKESLQGAIQFREAASSLHSIGESCDISTPDNDSIAMPSAVSNYGSSEVEAGRKIVSADQGNTPDVATTGAGPGAELAASKSSCVMGCNSLIDRNILSSTQNADNPSSRGNIATTSGRRVDRGVLSDLSSCGSNNENHTRNIAKSASPLALKADLELQSDCFATTRAKELVKQQISPSPQVELASHTSIPPQRYARQGRSDQMQPSPPADVHDTSRFRKGTAIASQLKDAIQTADDELPTGGKGTAAQTAKKPASSIGGLTTGKILARAILNGEGPGDPLGNGMASNDMRNEGIKYPWPVNLRESFQNAIMVSSSGDDKDGGAAGRAKESPDIEADSMPCKSKLDSPLDASSGSIPGIDHGSSVDRGNIPPTKNVANPIVHFNRKNASDSVAREAKQSARTLSRCRKENCASGVDKSASLATTAESGLQSCHFATKKTKSNTQPPMTLPHVAQDAKVDDMSNAKTTHALSNRGENEDYVSNICVNKIIVVPATRDKSGLQSSHFATKKTKSITKPTLTFRQDAPDPKPIAILNAKARACRLALKRLGPPDSPAPGETKNRVVEPREPAMSGGTPAGDRRARIGSAGNGVAEEAPNGDAGPREGVAAVRGPDDGNRAAGGPSAAALLQSEHFHPKGGRFGRAIGGRKRKSDDLMV